jgi:hypothetical protein
MTKTAVGTSVVLVIVAARIISAGGDDRPLSESFINWMDHPAIAYRTSATDDPVAALIRQMNDGRLTITADGEAGYLRSLLAQLKVPIEFQIAVFNKDSLQARRIERGNPRTIFFNDTVAVAWVRGGFIEIAAQSPAQGVAFYSLDRPWPLIGRPTIARRTECLICHYSYDTVGVPGMLVRSVGQTAVDHRLPLEQRCGGWYVTGAHGTIHHLGNADIRTLFGATSPTGNMNWPSLEGKLDTTGYLSPHSDITLLMVFDHQMHGMNLLSRIGWEARIAAYRQDHRESPPSDEAPIPLRDAAREIVDYLLFVDEAPLTSPIAGSREFQQQFESRGIGIGTAARFGSSI